MKYVNSIEFNCDKGRSILKDAETSICQLPKLKVAGSNPVSRSKESKGLGKMSNPFFIV